jgi:prevent-host-death family protein
MDLVCHMAPMRTVNIHEAKTQLSRLVEAAANGEPFIIAKAGKPQVKVVPLDAPDPGKTKRLGFMAGQIAVPDDFDTMGSSEIDALFAGR